MITKAYVVTEEQVAFLEELAAKEDRSVSWIVRQIIQDEMERWQGVKDEPTNEAQ